MNRSVWDILTEVAALVVVCLFALALVLLLSWTARGIWGAPVPPPKGLIAESLVGKWVYGYGPHADGRVWLFRDGTYTAYHTPDSVIHTGNWWVDGTAVELREWAYSPSTGGLTGPVPYRFDFRAGLSRGTCNGQRVSLSGRVPLDEVP
jgi:hypothetical protein